MHDLADGDRHPPEARAQKSQAAFRTISEVADELDVAQHVLRFWESKFPQVRPLKRGGGRRYYRPEDVELLRQIRSLLYHEGYTIKGAQKLLRGRRSRPAPDEETPRVPPAPPSPAAAPAAPAAPAAAVKPAAPDPQPAPATPLPVAPELRRRLEALRDELVLVKELLARARGDAAG